MNVSVRVIGRIETDVGDVGIAPSQAAEGRGATGRIVLDADLADGLLGLDTYRWLWLLTWLHDQPAGPPPLRLVPRATEATGTVQGVFASRAPARPSPIGLSLVEQLGIEATTITFRGVDLVDGTPVLDVKPWFADCDLPAVD